MTQVSEDDAVRFSEYLDGEMSDAEREAFEAELAADDALCAAFEEFSATLDVLGSLGEPEAIDLSEGVKSRIRRRSRGRYFGRRSAYRERMQTEVFLAVALAVLFGAVLLASPTGFKELFEHPDPVLVDEGSGEAPNDPAGDPAEPSDDGASDDGASDDGASDDGASEHGVGDGAARQSDPPSHGGDEVLPMDGSLARQGHTGTMPIREVAHHEYQYIVRTEQTHEELGDRLREQFGRGAVTELDGAYKVAVPRADVGAVLDRVSDLGTVRRELRPVSGDRRTLDIQFESGQ